MFESNACYKAQGSSELDLLAGMSKCPVSYECGEEMLFFEEGDIMKFEIKDLMEGTLCSYTIITDYVQSEEVYEFEALKMRSSAFIGGVYSNSNQ